ncbi:MAG: hypothetical protein J4N73_01580 [Chloroflexi bacterium]|nr:hypothetical protein [Chloroflexota bacterium]MCI0893110.1 hypothetical protein [Chloroflexota bacterium]
MRDRTKLLLVLALVALPVSGRLLWFHSGWYQPPEIPEIDESQIALPLPEYRPLADQPLETGGLVVIDLSHNNNLEVDDLTPLWDRLTARAVTIETLDDSSDSLETQLRGAIALLVIAPTSNYTAEERDLIADFVEDGGRLLLAADPTRPVPPEQEDEEEPLDLESIFFPSSAVPAINSLANAFGLVYFDDYLYNLVDNAGNYRNVKFTVLSDEHSLTQDLETIVFFAAHSLQTDGLSLVNADENTLSSLRSGETGLTAAALAANGRVLALGDVTALTPSFHTIADNDRFLSNIADWLAAASREWDLKDFPHLFRGPVDLVQVSEGSLDPRLIARSGTLQELFQQARLTLSLRAAADPDHDTLFVGTFDNVDLVQDYLATAGVAIVLAEADEEEEEPQDTIEIEGLGTLGLEGTTLYVVDRSADRVVVVALAEDGEAAIQALERLTSVDFSGCVHGEGVTVCSTDEVQEGLGLEADRDEPGQPPGEAVTPPRVAARSEAEAAFEAQTPWLQELAPETYDLTSQAGETYTYTIEMDRSQEVMWVYGWCTVTQEQLAQNWENISLVFTLDGESVPLDSFVRLEDKSGDLECRTHYALLADWPSGEHELTTEVTFATAINDGLDDFPAGTHIFEYRVHVEESSA